MATFGFLDWLWIVLYLFIMIGAGILFYRLGKRSESDFFLAGRGLPWWLPAASVYATHTATDTPMWVSGVIYRHGLAGIWYSFFAAWCAISAFVSTRIFPSPTDVQRLQRSAHTWHDFLLGRLNGPTRSRCEGGSIPATAERPVLSLRRSCGPTRSTFAERQFYSGTLQQSNVDWQPRGAGHCKNREAQHRCRHQALGNQYGSRWAVFCHSFSGTNNDGSRSAHFSFVLN